MSNSPRPTGATAPAGRSTSKTTAATVGLAVLLCIAAIAYLANRSSGGSTDNTGSGASTGPVTCDPPPALPGPGSTYSSPPDPSLAQDSVWTATLTTNCGDITLELYGDKAPQTVASFVFLAQHDYWADSTCHRLSVAGIFVLQCGDPTGSGTGDPGYGFGIENAPADGRYPAGTVAMARTDDPNSNGGQFFLVYRDTRLPTDGGGYSIFGRVTGGMRILRHIADAGVEGAGPEGVPHQPISLLSVGVQQE